MAFDLVFRNATVIDGTGSEPYAADVAVDGDVIAAIGDVGPARTDIDATGRAVCPGFIDIHTHDDWALRTDPLLAPKILQGVTTVVTGNCGMSLPSFAGWLDWLAAAPTAVNVAPLVGHGTIRSNVMGDDVERPATAAEVARMFDEVERSLDAGAFGLSTGLVYEPGRWSTRDELFHLMNVVARHGAIHTTHMRSESYELLESIGESITMSRETGVRLQISHLKAIGPENWHKIDDALRMISAARADGVDVAADQYPYSRGSTLLHQIVSAGAFRGPSVFGHLTGDLVTVASSPRTPSWEGRTVADIAAEMGLTDADAADAIVASEGESCAVVTASQSDDNIEKILRQEFVMIGSDGLPGGSHPHPRLHHTFPRVLGEYSRRRGTVSLVDAVRKMTSMPADRMGLVDRGRLSVGFRADIVMFDAQQVGDTGTYEHPTSVPAGIIGTWVRGVRTTADGRCTGERPGSVLTPR
ncbi:MAG: N-acyl-D-amino-acid deacylase family protein [Ilumatobacteraceae bacterium]